MGIRLSRASARNNGMPSHDDHLRCISGLRLSESRRRPDSIHEKAMEDLVGALEGFVPIDEIAYEYQDLTITQCCLVSLWKGTASERSLAYRAVGLLALTVGARTDEARFQRVFGAALASASNAVQESSDTATLVAALQCLAAGTFAAARRPEDTHQAMKDVMAVFIPRPAGRRELAEADQGWAMSPEVLDAAVSAWTLLLSTLVGLNTCPYERTEPHRLAELLQSHDIAVRTVAGVVLAMWAERVLTRHASPKNMQEPHDGAPSPAADMAHGQCPDPEETSTMPKPSGVLQVSTWARTVQLSFLKRFLGNGFDQHVPHNPLVREVATVTDDEAGELSCDEADGVVNQWHCSGEVVRAIKSWLQRVMGITRLAK